MPSSREPPSVNYTIRHLTLLGVVLSTCMFLSVQLHLKRYTSPDANEQMRKAIRSNITTEISELFREEQQQESSEQKQEVREEGMVVRYNLTEMSYPSKRVPLEKLNFCDIGWAGIERTEKREKSPSKGALTCPYSSHNLTDKIDPTCISCLKKSSMEIGERVLKLFQDKTHQKERRAKLQQWFDQADCPEHDDLCRNVVVVVAANELYLHLLKLWWCHANRLGLQPHQLVVYAFDDTVAEWAKSEQLLAIQPSLYEIKLPSRTTAYHKWSAYPLLADLSGMNKHIITNDIDLIWTSNMIKRLPTLWPDIHFISALAPRDDAVGKVNSAVLFFRNTPEIKVFLETMLSIIPITAESYHNGGDQNLWSYMLRLHVFRGLAWRPLPGHVVMRGVPEKFDKEQTLALHWIGKKGDDKLNSVKESLGKKAAEVDEEAEEENEDLDEDPKTRKRRNKRKRKEQNEDAEEMNEEIREILYHSCSEVME